MSTDPRLKPLGELRQLDLITSDEYDDTLAELQIIEIQRAHNAAEDIDVPELAMNADQIKTLAWLLSDYRASRQAMVAATSHVFMGVVASIEAAGQADG